MVIRFEEVETDVGLGEVRPLDMVYSRTRKAEVLRR